MNMIVNTDKVNIYMGSTPEGQVLSPILSSTGTPRIGEMWEEQGGIFAGTMPAENGHPEYHLILPTDEAAQSESLEWGGYGKTVEGLSPIDGKKNTELLMQHSESYPAATFCSQIQIKGHKDFYLPARREASLLAANVPHLFEEGWHWTSSQYSAYGAFIQAFSDGYQDDYHKDYDYRVRAVRRFINN